MDVPHDGTREGAVARGDVWGNIGVSHLAQFIVVCSS